LTIFQQGKAIFDANTLVGLSFMILVVSFPLFDDYYTIIVFVLEGTTLFSNEDTLLELLERSNEMFSMCLLKYVCCYCWINNRYHMSAWSLYATNQDYWTIKHDQPKHLPFINREEQIEKWLDAMWDTYSGDLKTTKEKSTMALLLTSKYGCNFSCANLF